MLLIKYTLEDIKAAEPRFWTKVKKGRRNECWEWLAGCVSEGYGSFRINSKVVMNASRVSLILASEQMYPAKEKESCHTCNNRICVNPYHLYWGTPKQNTQDSIRDGTFARNNLPAPDDPCMDKNGENNGRHKVTEEQVAEIRQKYIPRKYGIVKLAQEYDLSKSMISYIIRRENWKTV